MSIPDLIRQFRLRARIITVFGWLAVVLSLCLSLLILFMGLWELGKAVVLYGSHTFSVVDVPAWSRCHEPYDYAAANAATITEADEITENGSHTDANGKPYTSGLIEKLPNKAIGSKLDKCVVKSSLDRAITSLEFLFLAPIPYLICISAIRYMRFETEKGREGDWAGDINIRKNIAVVKAVSVALLIAVVASTVVGKALSNELALDFAISASVVMGVLVFYFAKLEHAATELTHLASTSSHEHGD